VTKLTLKYSSKISDKHLKNSSLESQTAHQQ